MIAIIMKRSLELGAFFVLVYKTLYFAKMPDKERILHIPESIEKQGISGQSKEIANNDKSTFRMPRQNPYFCLKRLKIKAFEE